MEGQPVRWAWLGPFAAWFRICSTCSSCRGWIHLTCASAGHFLESLHLWKFFGHFNWKLQQDTARLWHIPYILLNLQSPVVCKHWWCFKPPGFTMSLGWFLFLAFLAAPMLHLKPLSLSKTVRFEAGGSRHPSHTWITWQVHQIDANRHIHALGNWLIASNYLIELSSVKLSEPSDLNLTYINAQAPQWPKQILAKGSQQVRSHLGLLHHLRFFTASMHPPPPPPPHPGFKLQECSWKVRSDTIVQCSPSVPRFCLLRKKEPTRAHKV